jgi:hypothetical protein
MFPAFRSTTSAIGFCCLLIVLLGLPIITSLIGHPARYQAYAGVSSEAAGPVGAIVHDIYRDRSDADVLFLGSSLVRAGIDIPSMEHALSVHLGRPAHIQALTLNWQGLDLQYFLLRDYLKTHRAGLIVWNPPVPGSRSLEPHVEAFRWVRFGEYSDALSGLPLRYRLALYGDMILGAPRELLSRIRPNLLSEDEINFKEKSEHQGYYGAPFVPQSIDRLAIPPIQESYEVPPYTLLRTAGKPLTPYEDHFANKIVELAKENHTTIVLMHIPIDIERGMDYMPERGKWDEELHTDAPLIGLTSADLFHGVSQDRFLDFYRDQHLNFNGRLLFTRDITPAILKAYDAREQHE